MALSNTFEELIFENKIREPMTEGDIKQQLSYHYLGAIVARNGCKMEKPAIDYGVDAAIEWIDKVETVNGTRYSASGIEFHVQLKCTTENQISRRKGMLVYDFEEKNFNDLVRRFKNRKRSFEALTPLLLVVHVLPNDPASWIIFQEKGFHFAGEQYWFYANDEMNEVNRKSTMRIFIPLENKIELDFCPKIFRLLYSNVL